MDKNFFNFGHAKRKIIKNKRPTRAKRNHATPSLNVWGSQECGSLLASSFSIQDLDLVVLVVVELGSGVLTFGECGELIVTDVPQTVSFIIVHSDTTTSPLWQWLHKRQVLFLEYVPSEHFPHFVSSSVLQREVTFSPRLHFVHSLHRKVSLLKYLLSGQSHRLSDVGVHCFRILPLALSHFTLAHFSQEVKLFGMEVKWFVGHGWHADVL